MFANEPLLGQAAAQGLSTKALEGDCWGRPFELQTRIVQKKTKLNWSVTGRPNTKDSKNNDAWQANKEAPTDAVPEPLAVSV
jgi:hypothetical protein